MAPTEQEQPGLSTPPVESVGPEAIVDSSKNLSAQVASIFAYGIPWSVAVASPIALGMFALTGDPAPTMFVSLTALALTFVATLRLGDEKEGAPLEGSNGVYSLFGNLVDDALAPAGVQCYHPKFVGDIRYHVNVKQRSTRTVVVPNVETRTGTRMTVRFEITRFMVKWPYAYVNARIRQGGADPQDVMVDVLTAEVRSFVRLFYDEQVLNFDKLQTRLESVLSGQKDVIRVPKNGETTTVDESDTSKWEDFAFSEGDPRRTVNARLRAYGLWIPEGGVNISDITEPDDIADAKSEERQAEARDRTLASRVAARAKLMADHPGVDVDKVAEDIMVDAGLARMNIVRGSGGKQPGDFTTGAAVSSNSGGDKNPKQADNP